SLADALPIYGDAALDQLGLEDIEDSLHPVLGVRLHEDLLPGPRDRGAHALEVVALRDLLGGLVEGVVDLLPLDLRDDVETGVGHVLWLLVSGCASAANRIRTGERGRPRAPAPAPAASPTSLPKRKRPPPEPHHLEMSLCRFL